MNVFPFSLSFFSPALWHHEFDYSPNAIPQRCKCHQMAVWSLIFPGKMELVIRFLFLLDFEICLR